jgi:hypothetical protein
MNTPRLFLFSFDYEEIELFQLFLSSSVGNETFIKKSAQFFISSFNAFSALFYSMIYLSISVIEMSFLIVSSFTMHSISA